MDPSVVDSWDQEVGDGTSISSISALNEGNVRNVSGAVCWGSGGISNVKSSVKASRSIEESTSWVVEDVCIVDGSEPVNSVEFVGFWDTVSGGSETGNIGSNIVANGSEVSEEGGSQESSEFGSEDIAVISSNNNGVVKSILEGESEGSTSLVGVVVLEVEVQITVVSRSSVDEVS